MAQSLIDRIEELEEKVSDIRADLNTVAREVDIDLWW